jgi:glycosyltransferase involved in cell wall biosynthesis
MADIRHTVVVPCTVGEATIEQTPQSIYSQRIPATEIIMIDDASKDRTPQILAKHPRIRAIRLEHNLPRSWARVPRLNLALDSVSKQVTYIMISGDDPASTHVGQGGPEALRGESPPTNMLREAPETDDCRASRLSWCRRDFPLRVSDKDSALSRHNRLGRLTPLQGSGSGGTIARIPASPSTISSPTAAAPCGHSGTACTNWAAHFGSCSVGAPRTCFLNRVGSSNFRRSEAMLNTGSNASLGWTWHPSSADAKSRRSETSLRGC